MRVSAIIRWLLVASFASGLFFWLMLIVAQRFVRSEELIGVSFIVAGYCVPALICAMTLDRGRLRGLMWSGIAASLASAVLWVILVLMQHSLPSTAEGFIARFAGIASVWAGFCMILSALLHQRIDSTVARIICGFTIIAAAVLAMVGIASIWTEGELWRNEERMGQFFGAGAVLVTFGVILTLIIVRLRQITTGDATEEVVRLLLTAWCPRCGQQQTLKTGGDACHHCGLSIRVMVP